MSNYKKWLNICMDLAYSSSAVGAGKRRSKHGALVIKNGKIIGAGVNAMRGQASVQATSKSWRGSYIHAEEAAIRNAGTRASGATLFVARVNAKGLPLVSEPCVRCSGLIARYGIKRVVFT